MTKAMETIIVLDKENEKYIKKSYKNRKKYKNQLINKKDKKIKIDWLNEI